jgi:hypothetical protein
MIKINQRTAALAKSYVSSIQTVLSRFVDHQGSDQRMFLLLLEPAMMQEGRQATEVILGTIG